MPIPYARQSINQEDINSVVQVLQSDFLTQGPMVQQFEQAVAEYCRAGHAVAVCNATAALHLCCLALDVGGNDVIWTSPITYVASANAARYTGAEIDFVDIDEQTYNISITALEQKLIRSKQQNRLPKALIVVHFAGQSCLMQPIWELSKEYGFAIIEDASHALGGEYRQQKIGSCQYSDLCVFSFHPVKMITCGEGGMILSNHQHIAERLRNLRSAGISKQTPSNYPSEQGGWYYQQLELGYNYRLSDIHAALGRSQLKRLDQFLSKRRQIADRYYQNLRHAGINLPYVHEHSSCSWHLFVITLNPEQCRLSRKQLYEALHQAGIAVQVHYIPVHLQAYYQKLGFKTGDFPVAERYYQYTLSLPMYYDLSEQQQNEIINTLLEIL